MSDTYQTLVIHLDPVDSETGRWEPLCGINLYEEDDGDAIGEPYDWPVVDGRGQHCDLLSMFVRYGKQKLIKSHTPADNETGVMCKDCLGNKHWDMHVLNLTLDTV